LTTYLTLYKTQTSSDSEKWHGFHFLFLRVPVSFEILSSYMIDFLKISAAFRHCAYSSVRSINLSSNLCDDGGIGVPYCRTGRYVAVIPPGLVGDLSLSVLYEGTPVGPSTGGESSSGGTSGVAITRPPAAASPTDFTLSGALLANFTAGTPLDLAVEARDTFGNLLTELNATDALVVMWRPAGSPPGGDDERVMMADLLNGVASLENLVVRMTP
jgi:hypothetical protein